MQYLRNSIQINFLQPLDAILNFFSNIESTAPYSVLVIHLLSRGERTQSFQTVKN